MEIIMAKYGEIALKGLNKHIFEDMLITNIRRQLSAVGSFDYRRMQSTLYIQPKTDDVNLNLTVEKLQNVFGLAAIQRSLMLEKDFSDILNRGIPYLEESLSYVRSFKVEAKRSDKSFPMDSPALQRELGSAILEAYPHLKVDVHNPEITVRIEIRDRNALLNALKITGAGGMPVGSSGGALVLLSGGIDSPVAAYMLAKRGVRVSAVHFQTPPYTSERALMKVEELCEKISPYLMGVTLYCVNFTPISEALKKDCPEEYFTVIMRRLMVKISNIICKKNNLMALITGESVAQVASQTLQALACTDAVAEFPVFRPVIGMDKIEIMEIARKIGTFETSTLPYEDCCTVFTPRHPKTRPTLSEMEEAEKVMDYSVLIQEAIDTLTVKKFAI